MILQHETDDASEAEFTLEDAKALNRANDPINRLPPAARVLQEGRRMERADAFAVSNAAASAAGRETSLLQELEDDRRRLKGAYTGLALRDDAPQVVAVDAAIKARKKLRDR